MLEILIIGEVLISQENFQIMCEVIPRKWGHAVGLVI